MSLTLLPDEVLHIIGHQFLEPLDILALGSTCKRLHEAFLENPFDIDILKSKCGLSFCISRQWWKASEIALKAEQKIQHLRNERYWALEQICCTHRIKEIDNCVKLVKKLLADDSCISNLSLPTSTILDLAARQGYLAIFKLLYNVRRFGLWGPNALDKAAAKGHVEIVAFLLEHNPFTKHHPALGNAFVRACEKGRINVLKILLNDGRVDIGVIRRRSIMGAWRAWPESRYETTKFVLKLRNIIPPPIQFLHHGDTVSILNDASFVGDVELVDLMLQEMVSGTMFSTQQDFREREQNLRFYGMLDPSEAFIKAARNGQTKVVKRLLEDDRLYPSFRKNRALRIAAQNGHTEIVDLLYNDPRTTWEFFHHWLPKVSWRWPFKPSVTLKN